jgi:hypothetical protein
VVQLRQTGEQKKRPTRGRFLYLVVKGGFEPTQAARSSTKMSHPQFVWGTRMNQLLRLGFGEASISNGRDSENKSTYPSIK